MPTLVIRLDPRLLDNPDADIRYQLPDLLAERSAGFIRGDGYDYVGQGPMMLLFFEVSNLESALENIVDVVENVRVLDNDLRRAVFVAIQRDREYQVVYPPGFEGPFP